MYCTLQKISSVAQMTITCLDRFYWLIHLAHNQRVSGLWIFALNFIGMYTYHICTEGSNVLVPVLTLHTERAERRSKLKFHCSRHTGAWVHDEWLVALEGINLVFSIAWRRELLALVPNEHIVRTRILYLHLCRKAQNLSNGSKI